VSTPSDLSPGLHVELDGDGTLLVQGELDLASVPRLRRAFEEHRPPAGNVILDVSGLSFIDSTGLQELLDLSALLEDGAIVLRRPSASVRKLLHITGLDHTERIKFEPDGSAS
jgi:anti-anti-sigma factor